MTDITIKLTSLQAGLPQNKAPTLFHLRDVFERDRELFFQLPAVVEAEIGDPHLRILIRLARVVSVLMRDGYEVVSRSGRHVAEGTRGGFLPLADQVPDVRFLEQLWSKRYVKEDFLGVDGTSAEIDFFYADHDWIATVRSMRLFRLDPMDNTALSSGTPKYHYFQLVDCAYEVVSCPSEVFEGLREEGPLIHGHAYVGKPRYRWSNDGRPIEAPPDMLFVVYADPDGTVFDWDWERADPSAPNSLCDPTGRRFLSKVNDPGIAEFIFTEIDPQRFGEFQSWHPWYSISGDCVFCYFKESESFAKREDEFLTSYHAFNNESECVGFKLKHVSRLLAILGKWAANADEKILVHFSPDSVTVDLEFLMRAWLAQNLPRRVRLAPAMELFRKMEENAVAKVVLPRDLLELASS